MNIVYQSSFTTASNARNYDLSVFGVSTFLCIKFWIEGPSPFPITGL